MKYFDVPVLHNDILKKLGVSKLVEIEVKPDNDSLPLNCLNNVKRYILKNGGEIQFGWIFSVIGNVAIKKTGHAVVKTKSGDFLCVTPNEYRLGRLKFAPDNIIEKLIVNNCLPTQFVALVSNASLDKYLEIEREQDDLRLRNNGVVTVAEMQEINNKASWLYPDILALAKRYTKRNDYCYCGSTKKNKKCCS